LETKNNIYVFMAIHWNMIGEIHKWLVS